MLTSEQRHALRSVRGEVQEAVYLGIDPTWLIDQLHDEAAQAAEDYEADEGHRPEARA